MGVYSLRMLLQSAGGSVARDQSEATRVCTLNTELVSALLQVFSGAYSFLKVKAGTFSFIKARVNVSSTLPRP